MIGLLCFLFLGFSHADRYEEALTIRPLKDETTLTRFNFDFYHDSISPIKHARRYPRILDEITSNVGVVELELTLTRGWTDNFDAPLEAEAPNGAFLLATFEASDDIDQKWKTLVGQLAGLLCISLNQLDHQASLSPPWHLPGFRNIQNLENRRIGFLPREVACTENLTPWKKLLATGSVHGLGHFLTNPHHQMQKSTYWSIGLKFSQSNDGKFLKLTHTMVIDVRKTPDLDLVLNLARTNSTIVQKGTLSPYVLFGVSQAKTSPIVSSTNVNFLVCDTEQLKIENSDYEVENVYDNYGRICQDYRVPIINKVIGFGMKIEWPTSVSETSLISSISVVRFNGGAGLDGKSKIISKIENKFPEEKSILALELMPWWINPKISNIRVQSTETGKTCAINKKLYTPAKDIKRATGSLFLYLTVAPLSTCLVTYDYETRWPKWTEYPADSSYGRFLPSQMIIYSKVNSDGTSEQVAKAFSGPLLLYVPIPDFSMPYNVLCLVSTVIAMGIGAVHNLTTSQLVPSDSKQPDTNLGKIIYFLKNAGQTILMKLKKKSNKTESESPCIDNNQKEVLGSHENEEKPNTCPDDQTQEDKKEN